jgi:4-hydroxy-2-oxoglutarate aldolase
VGGHGAITGLANVAPVRPFLVHHASHAVYLLLCRAVQYTIAKLQELSVAALADPTKLAEAQSLQAIAARADFTIAKASISGTKYLLEKLYGYGGLPRKPLPPIEADTAQKLWEHPHTQELVQTERSLSGKL